MEEFIKSLMRTLETAYTEIFKVEHYPAGSETQMLVVNCYNGSRFNIIFETFEKPSTIARRALHECDRKCKIRFF